MTTYTVTLSSGSTNDIPAASAAIAIQTALERNLGQTVLHCYSGRPSELGSAGSMYGRIEYDTPPHVALPLTWKPPVRVRAKDTPVELFDDTALKSESALAREKTSRGTLFSKSAN